MTDDTQPVGDNAKLEDIAKMPIDIQLLDLRISRSMGGHRAISGFIRIIILIEVVSLSISFKLLDNAICVFRIIFSNESLNARRIKDSYLSFGRIDRLTDWFSEINKVIKNELNVINKILFKTSDFRSIRTLEKPQNSRSGFE